MYKRYINSFIIIIIIIIIIIMQIWGITNIIYELLFMRYNKYNANMSYTIVCGSRIPSMKTPISKKFKLRNKTFVWIGRVRNVIKLNVL